jgi:zinc/manganese transport system permease protein
VEDVSEVSGVGKDKLVTGKTVKGRPWTRYGIKVGGMVYAAVGIAVAASFGGLLLSYHADLPSGPAVVLVAGLGWVVSLLFGRVDGVTARLRRRHLAG